MRQNETENYELRLGPEKYASFSPQNASIVLCLSAALPPAGASSGARAHARTARCSSPRQVAGGSVEAASLENAPRVGRAQPAPVGVCVIAR